MIENRWSHLRPETGKGWEAEGIAPDVETPYAAALDRAVEMIKASSTTG